MSEDRELVQRRQERCLAGDEPPKQYEIGVLTPEGDRNDIDLRASRIEYGGEEAVLVLFRGSVAARLIDEELGANVVGVSDSSGAVYDPDGLDVTATGEYKTDTGQLLGYPDASEEPTNEELLTRDVDLLIPAALENAIDADLAERVSADIIVEAANGPLTPDADDVVTDRDVAVFPDILANAGGVTVSYFEWVQNRQRFSRPEQRVNEELERVVTDAFDTLTKTYEETGVSNYRTAAYVTAIERVADAADEAGTFP